MRAGRSRSHYFPCATGGEKGWPETIQFSFEASSVRRIAL